MQTTRRALVPAALVSFARADGADKNPLSAVFSLMDELTAKITKDGEAAAKAYHEYYEWCDETAANAANAIKTAEEDKKQLEAKIEELTSEISASDTKIGELAETIAEAEKELKDATAIREKEAADFAANEKELMEGVDALTRASAVISKEAAKNPASLAQVSGMSTASALQALSVVFDAASFNSQDQKRLVALVQAHDSDDDEDGGAPAAAVYKNKSGGIVDVIEDMKEKAEGQLSDLRKEERTTAHNFKMLKQSLEAQIADDNKHLDSEKAAKATAEEDKATAEKDLDVTVKELAAQKEQLATCQGSCIQTAADYEATIAARKEELSVIAKAKQILKESTSGAESQTYSLVQLSTSATHQLAGSEVVAALRRLAKQDKSPALAQLASRVTGLLRHGGRDDVFGKVKGLIRDMIAKLEKEADADAEEKAWCDEQMSKTAAKKGDLEDDIEKATARIDAAEAKSAKLKEELQVLASELSALAKEQAELDKIRGEEHSDYVASKGDLEAGLTGVRKALEVLQEYYGSASLLQEDQPAPPEKFQKGGGAGGSIVDILQTVESDFATNLAKVEAEESDAQSEYDKVTQENAVTKTAKEGDVKYKTQEAKSLDKTSAEYKGDRETAKTELEAVDKYFAEVKDRCIAKPETYEDRKARREAEIAGLKEAMSILENETAFLQHKNRGHRFLRTLSAQ